MRGRVLTALVHARRHASLGTGDRVHFVPPEVFWEAVVLHRF